MTIRVSRCRALTLVLIISTSVLAGPVSARPANRNDNGDLTVTFDTVVPAGSYSVYVELRDLGQQAGRGGFVEILAPLLRVLGIPQGEGVSAFAAGHRDLLSRSRMLFASVPARQGIPQLLIALEAYSSDAARELEPDLRRFLGSMAAPRAATSIDNRDSEKPDAASAVRPDTGVPTEAESPFCVKVIDRLILISDTPIVKKNLWPEDVKPASYDAGFRSARARFSSEPLFLYFDIQLSERAERVRREEYQKSEQEIRIRDQAAGGLPERTIADHVRPSPPVEEPEPETSPLSQSPKIETIESATASVPQVRPGSADADLTGGPVPGNSGNSPFEAILSILLAGAESGAPVNNPNALAAAAAIEGDEVIARLLLLSAASAQESAIPFLPFLIPGPPATSEAASYLPADTELFFSASLDLERVYDLVLRVKAEQGPPTETRVNTRKKQAAPKTFASQIVALEKRHGFKIKEHLLAALGNEISIGASSQWLMDFAGMKPQSATEIPKSAPVILISVRNPDLLRSKLVPAMEALGLKSSGEKGVKEKCGDLEFSRYNRSSIALVDNFVIIAQEPDLMRRLLTARGKQQTLGASKGFRDYMRWQPRHTLLQIHVSSALMKGMLADAKNLIDPSDQRAGEFLAQLNIDPEPITYAASAEGEGTLHELHLPKSLLTFWFGQASAASQNSLIASNEMVVRGGMAMINQAQVEFKKTEGRFASLEELNKGPVGLDAAAQAELGYRIEVSASGSRYTATAVPIEYGKTGRLSFYTDESGVIREGDHAGSPASLADKPRGGKEPN